MRPRQSRRYIHTSPNAKQTISNNPKTTTRTPSGRYIERLFYWERSEDVVDEFLLHSNENVPHRVSLTISKGKTINISSNTSKRKQKFECKKICQIVCGHSSLNRKMFAANSVPARCFSVMSKQGGKVEVIHLEGLNEVTRDRWIVRIHESILDQGKMLVTGVEDLSQHLQETSKLEYSDVIQIPRESGETERTSVRSTTSEFPDDFFSNSRALSENELRLIHEWVLPGMHFNRARVPSLVNAFEDPHGSILESMFVYLSPPDDQPSILDGVSFAPDRSKSNSARVLLQDIHSIFVCMVQGVKTEFYIKIMHGELPLAASPSASQASLAAIALYGSDLRQLLQFAKGLALACEAHGIDVMKINDILASEVQSSVRKFESRCRIFCGTYNIGASRPNQSFESWLHPEVDPLTGAKTDMPLSDIYCVGFQEIVDLGGSAVLREHSEHLPIESNIATVLGSDYVKVESITRGGTVLFIFAHKDLNQFIEHVQTHWVNIGFMGAANKVGLAIRFDLFHRSVCFVCAHFNAGEGLEKMQLRNADYQKIVDGLIFESDSVELTLASHDLVIWCGDLNYRIAAPESELMSVIDLIRRKKWKTLVEKDELQRSMKAEQAFHGYRESKIRFPPTYKFLPGTHQYGGKNRIPSYTDRILWKVNTDVKVKCRQYYISHHMMLSDHKPVYATFDVTLERKKSYATPINEEEKQEVQTPLSIRTDEDFVPSDTVSDDATLEFNEHTGDDPLDEKLALVYFHSRDLTKTLIKLKKQRAKSRSVRTDSRLSNDTAHLLMDIKEKLSRELDELMNYVLVDLAKDGGE